MAATTTLPLGATATRGPRMDAGLLVAANVVAHRQAPDAASSARTNVWLPRRPASAPGIGVHFFGSRPFADAPATNTTALPDTAPSATLDATSPAPPPKSFAHASLPDAP